MATAIVEDYLKAILNIGLGSRTVVVSTGALANQLKVSHGTASKTIRSLAKAGLVKCCVYKGAELTEEGRLLAMSVVRKHRLVELFLATVLNMEWDEIHTHAEKLEHVISGRLANRIDDFLGNPVFDPHGDPIPTADGELPKNELLSLARCSEGVQFVIGRILDQSCESLRYLSTVGVRVGVKGHVCNNCDIADLVSVVIDDRRLCLAHDSAAQILVSPR